MNVGIMSMQRIINYGSFLQAWGLKSVVQQMDHNVQFVDFTVEPPILTGEEYNDTSQSNNTKISPVLKSLKKLTPSYIIKRQVNKKVYKTFNEYVLDFSNKWLPMLGVTEGKNIQPELDLLIIGSDEVFNCTQTQTTVGYSLELFGKNNCAKKVISYAASFGNTTIEKLKMYNKEQEIGDLLNRFNAISVRDDNSRNIIKTLCDINPYYHIDPVLLYDFAEEVPNSVPMKDYIIFYAYCERFSEEEGKAARDYAHKHGKKLISLGFWQSCCDEYVKATPFEVLAYFKNADCVITDTFHGTIMSVKYNKKFAFLSRESNKQKALSLLSDFKLTDRIVEKAEDLEGVMESSICYDYANKYLYQSKINAMEYLKTQLE